MASSKRKKKDIKKIVEKEIQPKEKKSLRITKKQIEKIMNEKKAELKKKKEFKKRLEITVQNEQTKISELEGAILALYEVLTGEKVE